MVTRASVRELAHHGHAVTVETGAGVGCPAAASSARSRLSASARSRSDAVSSASSRCGPAVLLSSKGHFTVDALRASGVKLLDTPDTYYELVDKRIPGHGEDLAELKKRKILVDGKAGELLLQIFSENQLGPIFFEIIQRKGDEGFGEGNFKALFESMELDQVRRGVLHT